MEKQLKVLAYTLSPWEHAIVNYRLAGPCSHAGMELYRGNLYEDVRYDVIDKADLVIIQRDFPRLVEQFCAIVDRARSLRKPVILDLDDNLFELPPDHPDCLTHYYTEALYPTVMAAICVDAVTTSTKPLRDYLSRVNPNTYLLPNYLDTSIWDVSKSNRNSINSNRVIIGYVGGESHYPDLKMIKPVLESILDQYKERVLFHFWGVKPPLDYDQCENVLWTELRDPDYKNFAAYMIEQVCDIVMAPLQDNLFNRSKSPVKYYEYSILGLPGVFSRIKPYEDVVKHGRNGFLAGTNSDWQNFLTALIDDAQLRLNMGMAARKDVNQNWLVSDHAHWWKNTYTRIISVANERKTAQQFPTDIIRCIGQQNKK